MARLLLIEDDVTIGRALQADGGGSNTPVSTLTSISARTQPSSAPVSTPTTMSTAVSLKII